MSSQLVLELDSTPLYSSARQMLQRLADTCASSGPTVPLVDWLALYAEAEHCLAAARACDEVAELLDAERITKAQAARLYSRQARDVSLERNAATVRVNAMRWAGALEVRP